MSRTHLGNTHTHQSFPRVSGDEPYLLIIWCNTHKFSPRERG